MNKTKRLVFDGILTAAALTIFVAEAQLPTLIPVSGIKPGLSNIITLFALLNLSAPEAFMILISRILLGAFAIGNPSVLLYSLAGGTGSLLTELLLLRVIGKNRVWAISAFGGIFHNFFQLICAALITQSTAVFWYLPVLILSGLITGLFTGLCIYYANNKISRFL